MILEPLELEGAYRIRPPRYDDERGYFERLFSRDEFAALGLEDCGRQVAHVMNRRAGTLRGLHFQRHPHGETKLIWVCRGTIFDVLVDLRPASATFGAWQGFELSAEDGTMIYAPRGLAHGYLTLTDDCRMIYQIDVAYAPNHAAGIRYDDPDLAIAWPAAPSVINDRDRILPTLAELGGNPLS